MNINYNSPCLRFANKTIEWIIGDTEEVYNINIKKNLKKLIYHKWYPFKSIKYSFNGHGFRCNNFDHDPESILFLGCSHSFGLGINIEDTFSYIISKKLNLKLINLSIPASSANTAYRLGSYWIPKLNPKIVVYTEPDYARLEIINTNLKNSIINLGLSFCKVSDLYSFYRNYWLSDETNYELNAEKNRLALEYICLKNNIKFIADKWDNWLDYLDYARDLRHAGIKSHIAATSKILNII